jgi:hypothetical protein
VHSKWYSIVAIIVILGFSLVGCCRGSEQTYEPTVDTYKRVADFETCFGMGSAAAPGDSLAFECVPVKCREGIVVKLDHETDSAWAAFWIGLDDADFSSHDTLTFFARGDYPRGSLPVFKVELKRWDNTEIGIVYISGLTDEWQQFTVPFEDIRQFGNEPFLCGWDEMSELVFTFETAQSGPQGTLYVDDIYVERRGQGAPPPGPECVVPPAATFSSSPTIADFDRCTGVNNLGGPMGAAYNAPDNLEESYPQEPGRGCVARLAYDVSEWSAFWLKLERVDLGPYSQLVFDVRAEPEPGVSRQIKIELKRARNREVSIVYVSGITADWQTVRVDLADFGPTGYTTELSSLTGMEELVLTFEASQAGSQGVVYLDDIRLEP